ncbi:mitogen-activated protein kinase kinase kinase 20-like [Impatiens glandulifera]|uniref:mitogen-activated protein kinase kinase kinase 20-like n=1 Tax=Impatiens glandulifera TaxID=253017 RepID=UPI001FB0790C|nr:mitogen-activated protein kinase kinase kinase 20-like [Impatiens glandulifera]
MNDSTIAKMNDSDQWWKRGRVLGIGGYGVVYEARPLPDDPISLNLPPLMAAKSFFSKDSLDREKQVLSIFKDDHPNIIGYYGCSDYNIFLEYASDGDLYAKIKKTWGGLSEKEVSEYVKGILLGLKYIHKLGLVHCDIKPENILLTGDGVPKIADFGLAMRAGVIREIDARRGTPEYMAPEVITHGVYNWWCDIWALGCTVLKMFTGQNVWGGFPSNKDIKKFIAKHDVIPVIPDSLSFEAIDFLQRCLVRDFRSRWNVESLLQHPFVLRKAKDLNL